jgi:hypothetical protein
MAMHLSRTSVIQGCRGNGGKPLPGSGSTAKRIPHRVATSGATDSLKAVGVGRPHESHSVMLCDDGARFRKGRAGDAGRRKSPKNEHFAGFGALKRKVPVYRTHPRIGRRACWSAASSRPDLWYRFTDAKATASRIGRTITAPGGEHPRPVNFAFVSCQTSTKASSTPIAG